MRERVVVVCISGWAANADSGMIDFANRLRDELSPLGINGNNIFHRSWNHGSDGDATDSPDVGDIIREIANRLGVPSYIGLVGHSYGGWAACRVSIASELPKPADFIGMVDRNSGV